MRNNWKELELDELENINGGDDYTLIKWPNLNYPDSTRYIFKNNTTGGVYIFLNYKAAYEFVSKSKQTGDIVDTHGQNLIWYRLLKETGQL